MKEPRLSVLMTLYNKGAFVKDAIGSVLESGFEDFELLVVDDGSTDDGPDQLQRFDDERIRFLPSAENTGRAAAANRGLDAARGELIAVLDADDIAARDRFEKQVLFLDSNPDVGLVGSAARVFGSRDRVVSWPMSDHQARATMLFEDPLLYGSCMYRRALVQRNGIRYREGWREPGMDYLFILAMAAHTRMANLAEPLTSYRLGPQNFRHGRSGEEIRGRILAEALKWFGIEVSCEEVRMMMMLEQAGPAPRTESEVEGLWRWVCRLKSLNQGRRLFPPELFEQRLMRDWRRWFYVLADSSWSLARKHARCEGGHAIGRNYYLARTIRARRTKGSGPY